MFIVIIVHFEFFSVFSLFAWERIGMVSSAEGFVALSGMVLGVVYKKRIDRIGLLQSTKILWKRSFLLYRVNVFVILSVVLLGLIPGINVFDVTHWAPVNQDIVYPLYPSIDKGWDELLLSALLLRCGPHQFQIIGLYVGLIFLAPVILFALHKKKTYWVLLVSIVLYGINSQFEFRLSGAKFELGFPLLTWQLLFVLGMLVGFHKQVVLTFLIDRSRSYLLYIAGLVSLLFFLLAINNPNAVYWPWTHLALIDGDFFYALYMDWFQKPTLGLGRIINNIALFIGFYVLLTRYWSIVNRGLGGLFIPLGQASLYVFIVHVYLIIIVNSIPYLQHNSVWINSLIHASVVLLIWWMINHRFLYRLIPR